MSQNVAVDCYYICKINYLGCDNILLREAVSYELWRKNRFYCLDKEQKKITFETKLEAEMKNYLQETYGISDMNLKAIRLNEMEWWFMYVYQLTHVRGVDIKVIGYFGSWKKARQVMKKYRSQVQGFKDYPRCFKIKKLRVNQDDFYYG